MIVCCGQKMSVLPRKVCFLTYCMKNILYLPGSLQNFWGLSWSFLKTLDSVCRFLVFLWVSINWCLVWSWFFFSLRKSLQSDGIISEMAQHSPGKREQRKILGPLNFDKRGGFRSFQNFKTTRSQNYEIRKGKMCKYPNRIIHLSHHWRIIHHPIN